MKRKRKPLCIEGLESRVLFAWSAYAHLVGQDTAAAQFSSITGAGTTVAVIDTGIDYTQPSLGGGFGPSFKVIGGYDFADNDSDPMDESGHGTSVAGVIAANTYAFHGVTYQGVAPGAKLVALRVGTEDSITNANIAKALQWVIDNYAKFHISVVNISLGASSYATAQTDSTFSPKYQKLHDLGIFVVAASGNSNDQQLDPISQDGVAYPAADPNVFAAGAVDANDVIATWSQRGSELDLLAPGVDIVMPKLGGGFVAEDGTSFASPYVAGTAALIRQEDPTAKAGDVGSILMSSGVDDRDGDNESGNTTGLLFSRLNIPSALTLAQQRVGKTATLAMGGVFDTALDSQGVLHAAYYDAANHDLIYATRDTSGLWSSTRVIDSAGVVGYQLSIAVDASGKVGIGYFDATNSAVKYASFDGTNWSITTVESAKNVGSYPSLAFGIDGTAYLAYYRRTSGDLKLATLDRDAGTWTRVTVDGANADVGVNASIDVGEAPVRSGFFTVYDTTVAIAYADKTNGDLKYARLDVDNPSATWYIAVVDNTTGVGNISLNLHAGPTSSALQAQIAYQDLTTHTVKYAYRNTNWFVEAVLSASPMAGPVRLDFNPSNQPVVTSYLSSKRAYYAATRTGKNVWSVARVAFGSGPMSTSQNERTGDSILTTLSRDKQSVSSSELV